MARTRTESKIAGVPKRSQDRPALSGTL